MSGEAERGMCRGVTPSRRRGGSSTGWADSRRVTASPKRSAPERRGLHAWLPYYAGFSEGFVADTLSELAVGADQLVLDPMNGSGTTTMVAQQCGHIAIGVELNPAMAIIARAKDPTFLGCDCAAELAKRIVKRAARRRYTGRVSEHTAAWIPPRIFQELKCLDAEISRCDESPIIELDHRLANVVPPSERQTGGRARDLLRAALLITARKVSSSETSKNPTWLKPGNGQPDDGVDVFTEFPEVVATMLADLEDAYETRPSSRRVLVLEADAKELPLPDNSVDAIVTSPPYLTRIDYAVGTTPELVLLGYESEESIHQLRGAIMGSTCVTGGAYHVRQCWGKTCLTMIDSVRRHPSKASAGYYLKMHLQYFRDAEAVLRECLRVLKRGAPAIFVVQDSWYKDIHVPLGAIYVEMARALGASTAGITSSDQVRSHLGLVNTRARKYAKGELFEHVVLVRGRKT